MSGQTPRAPRTGASVVFGAILALAWVAPVVGQNIDELSVRVDSIIVIGNRRHAENDVINRSGLRVGNIVRGPQVQDAIRRLFSSGDFNDWHRRRPGHWQPR
jgi:outer membrane protein assembly factor BamA